MGMVVWVLCVALQGSSNGGVRVGKVWERGEASRVTGCMTVIHICPCTHPHPGVDVGGTIGCWIGGLMSVW
jgi:hypothetical protein